MRISCLSVSDQLGGSEAALLNMIAGLKTARPGWDFQVIVPGSGPLKAHLELAGARCSVVRMPAQLACLGESAAIGARPGVGARLILGMRLCATATTLPGYEARLRRALAEFHPHILHTNGFKAHVLGARVRRPHERLVWHLHEYVSPRPVTRRLLQRYAGRCDAILANSASVAADAQCMNADARRMHVVHNAVDLERFSPSGSSLDLDALAGLPPAPAGTIRIGLVAASGRWKGHDIFLDAIRALRPSRPTRGYIIGGALYDTSGSQYSNAELRSMIDARGLAGSVGLTGFLDAAYAMRSLEIVVHASVRPEPFGLVIAEAMAAGRPVITTGEGGAAELVHGGVDAFVTPAGDAHALAAAMARLASDAALRAAIGTRARAAAVARFGQSRMASQLSAVFEAVVREPLAESA